MGCKQCPSSAGCVGWLYVRALSADRLCGGTQWLIWSKGAVPEISAEGASEKGRTTTSSTPSPRTPDAVFALFRGGRTGVSTSGVSFLGFCLRVQLLALLLYGKNGREKRKKGRIGKSTTKKNERGTPKALAGRFLPLASPSKFSS